MKFLFSVVMNQSFAECSFLVQKSFTHAHVHNCICTTAYARDMHACAQMRRQCTRAPKSGDDTERNLENGLLGSVMA